MWLEYLSDRSGLLATTNTRDFFLNFAKFKTEISHCHVGHTVRKLNRIIKQVNMTAM